MEIDGRSEGVTKPIARAKTKTKILEKMVDIAKERVGDEKLRVAILHTRAREQAEKFRNLISSQLPCDEIYLAEGSATVAVFNGRGLIDLGFHSSD